MKQLSIFRFVCACLGYDSVISSVYVKLLHFIVAILVLTGCSAKQSSKPKTLSAKDASQGFFMLFDGMDEKLSNFRGVVKEEIPQGVWIVKEGQILCVPRNERPEGAKGSILTKQQFSDFDLQLEYKLGPEYEGNINSGVKYFVYPGTELGLEYQIFDSDMEIIGPHALGDLYDILEATGQQAKPRGVWNKVRIVSEGKHVEHWLNDKKVLEFERGSKAFRASVANSKFKNRKAFGEVERGHILLQDHGGGIAFRNIRIKASVHTP
jgi:hypothetical protein